MSNQTAREKVKGIGTWFVLSLGGKKKKAQEKKRTIVDMKASIYLEVWLLTVS